MNEKQIIITIHEDPTTGTAQMSCERKDVGALEAVSVLADAQKAFLQQYFEAMAVKAAGQSRIQIARQ